jgi:hypothetical protein
MLRVRLDLLRRHSTQFESRSKGLATVCFPESFDRWRSEQALQNGSR